MPDPRLTVVAPNFPPKIGGIESFVLGLAKHAWPHSTTVITNPQPGGSQWDRQAPFHVERCALAGRLPPRWRPAIGVVKGLESTADVILFSEWWPAARAAGSLGMRRGARRPLRVLVAYGTEITSPAGRALSSLQKALAGMDLVIAISRYTADRLKQRVDDCPDVEVLNPGVDLCPDRIEPDTVRAALGLGSGPLVLTAARLVPRKGHVEFARHWPKVEACVPGAQWVVAGDGPCRRELEALATPSVRMVGEIDRPTLMGLFALADVHVLPGLVSDQVEGFGLVLNEAGAAGTPSVTSDCGGAAEALGRGGVLVEAGDMERMAAAIAELLLDSARRDSLGREARARAGELSWDAVGQRFRELISRRLRTFQR